MKSLTNSRVVLGIVTGVLLFIALNLTLTPYNLTILLNSLFAGALVSIAVSYKELLWEAIKNDGAYNRTRQFTISVFIQWLALAFTVSTSMFISVYTLPYWAYMAITTARYLAVVAAVLQVMAPDLGYNIFHGRDRKSLTVSFTAGLVVAFVTIILQKA